MKGTPASVRVLIDRRSTSLQLIARATLEMTTSCYTWLERERDHIVVSLSEKYPLNDDIEARFQAELERLSAQERLERRTRLVRSAIVARALGPVPRREPAPTPAPVLDPETEAEIEKLLAEIESDDWLEDASEIAKTWEERFGTSENPECKEDGES